MSKLHIQDVYAISMKLHQFLVQNKIHYTKNEFEFEVVWRDSLRQMQHLLVNKDFDIIGNYEDLLNKIDWNYSHKPHHRE